jgi:hypothetical protein
LTDPARLEPVARRVVEMMALALQASLLVRHSSSPVADAFCATRLDGDWGRAFGTLPQGLDTQAIVDRARITEMAGLRPIARSRDLEFFRSRAAGTTTEDAIPVK